MTEEWLARAEFQIYTQFNTHRNELFFAKKVLLVEGPSDKILFSTLAKERWGLIWIERIVVIDCGWQVWGELLAGVCNLMGLTEVFAVWDQDDDDFNPTGGNYLPDMLTAGQGLEVPVNLESFLGLPQGEGSNCFIGGSEPCQHHLCPPATVQAFLASAEAVPAAQPAPAAAPATNDDDIPF